MTTPFAEALGLIDEIDLQEVFGELRAFVDALRPVEEMLPSEFAERYRDLKEGTTDKPGSWSNDYAPYLVAIMDAIDEALRTGKRGVVLMKAAQGGGSEAIINVVAWLLYQHPGPILYLISTDDIAREFGKDRFSHLIRTCPPLTRKAFIGKSAGETILVKRFTDGKLAVYGGGSVNKIQSVPYRFVIIDEVDSLKAEMGRSGQDGDPRKVAEMRTSAFKGETLIIAFAHPTTRDQGAGELYYELSDQRRAFIQCPHCDQEFWLDPECIRVLPPEGQSIEEARRNPSAYRFVTPCCGCELSDGQRYAALGKRPPQKSTLAPEEAAKKEWIGLHFGALCYLHWPMDRIAKEIIQGIDNPAIERVVVNKVHGDVYREKIEKTTEEQWRRLIVLPRGPTDTRAYLLGQVPPEVRFLTAGQDSRATELHWSVWGWGLVLTSAATRVLCGWLIDYGVIERDPPSQALVHADLIGFDALLYDRRFPRLGGKAEERGLGVEKGLHDCGWQPTGVYEYCLGWIGRALPVRGRAVDERSTLPVISEGPSPSWNVGREKFSDKRLREVHLNTFKLKVQWFGLAAGSFEAMGGERRPFLHLPRDVGDDIVAQLASEFLTVQKRKKVWKHKGPNHWSDTALYAFGAALDLGPLQGGMTREEAIQAAQQQEERTRRARADGRRSGRGGGAGGVRRSY